MSTGGKQMVNNGQNWINVVKERPNMPIVIELTFGDSNITIPYYCQTTEFNLNIKPVLQGQPFTKTSGHIIRKPYCWLKK